MVAECQRFAGSIRNGNADAIARAFANSEWTADGDDDEMTVEGGTVFLDIAVDEPSPGGGNYYVLSGNVDGTLDEAAATLARIGKLLETAEVRFRFELRDAQAAGGYRIIEHPNY